MLKSDFSEAEFTSTVSLRCLRPCSQSTSQNLRFPPRKRKTMTLEDPTPSQARRIAKYRLSIPKQFPSFLKADLVRARLAKAGKFVIEIEVACPYCGNMHDCATDDDGNEPHLDGSGCGRYFLRAKDESRIMVKMRKP